MARARNIKPGFFKNELLAEMPPEVRLLFIGLWCIADREGRFEDRPKKIKMELFPCDSFSIEDGLSLLAGSGFLVRYEVGNGKYAQVVNFTKHQMPHHKEVPSEIPAPPGFAQITKHSYDVPKEIRDLVFSRDEDTCRKCGSKENLSIDHIIPLSQGGDNATSNLQTLCKTCNSSKGNTTKDYRAANVGATLNQRCVNGDASMVPVALLNPDSLNPESILLSSTSPVSPPKPTTEEEVVQVTAEQSQSAPSAQAPQAEAPGAIPPCPINAILDAFSAELPMLAQPRRSLFRDGKDADALRQRWRWVLTSAHESGPKTGLPLAISSADGVAWFRRFFGFVAQSDWLTGNVKTERHWQATLGWLVNKTNFAKVINGDYINKNEAVTA